MVFTLRDVRGTLRLVSVAGGVHKGLNPSNAALLEGCRSGDQLAWAGLVRRYERLVYAIALREGSDADVASDIAQETFAELLRSIDSIREPEQLSHWLATVCRRTAWKRRHTPTDLALDMTDEIIGSADFADDPARAFEIYDVVQALGEPCRSLIIGLFFDPAQPDYASIAVQLGRPPGSIGPLRGRCLARLRTLLAEVSADA